MCSSMFSPKIHSTYIEHRDQAVCQVGAYERLGKWRKKKPFHNFSTFDMDYLRKICGHHWKERLENS